MNIVLMGSKGAGKSTLGAALAHLTGLEAIDTDRRIEAFYETETGKAATCRTIFQTGGEEKFRAPYGAPLARRHVPGVTTCKQLRPLTPRFFGPKV